MIWKIALHLPFESVRRVIDWSVGVFLIGLLMYRLGGGVVVRSVPRYCDSFSLNVL